MRGLVQRVERRLCPNNAHSSIFPRCCGFGHNRRAPLCPDLTVSRRVHPGITRDFRHFAAIGIGAHNDRPPKGSMNNRRKLFIAFAASALTAPLRAFAQRQGKVWRIGFLTAYSRQALAQSGRIDAFLQEMRKLGYVEGKNLDIEWRFADENYEHLVSMAIARNSGCAKGDYYYPYCHGKHGRPGR